MIRYQNYLSEFDSPFRLALYEDKDWVKMSGCIPWGQLAKAFYEGFSATQGRPTKDASRERHSVYPKVVLGGRIYGNRENYQYLKDLGIRFARKVLGSSKKVAEENRIERKRLVAERRENYLKRKLIAGKFRQGPCVACRYLDRVHHQHLPGNESTDSAESFLLALKQEVPKGTGGMVLDTAGCRRLRCILASPCSEWFQSDAGHRVGGNFMNRL